jgi:hypothetical protein
MLLQLLEPKILFLVKLIGKLFFLFKLAIDKILSYLSAFELVTVYCHFIFIFFSFAGGSWPLREGFSGMFGYKYIYYPG